MSGGILLAGSVIIHGPFVAEPGAGQWWEVIFHMPLHLAGRPYVQPA
jgi:hypothetical protein